jgi:GNAT superfamily N-acetyltransferase
MPVDVRPEPLGSPTGRALIAALDAEMDERYPDPSQRHPTLGAEQVADGVGMFVVAWQGDVAVGCGALRTIEARVAELKRMFVVPEARGAGIGGEIVLALLAEAQRLGIARVVLETGVRQQEAMRLYERHGFQPIPCWGEYIASQETSRCYALDLSS